jgi:hypothetical protein
VRTFTDGATNCVSTSGAPTCVYASTDTTCNTPPAVACAPGNDAIRTYADSASNCSAGACVYTFEDVDCDSPPAAICAPGNDAIRTYTDTGTNCTAGSPPTCTYGFTDSACNTPPATTCNATNTGRVTYADGTTNCTINGGAPSCTYTATETLCNTPPAASCSGNTLTTYNATGTCGGVGTCTYATQTVNCADTGRLCSAASGTAQCVSSPPTITNLTFEAPTNNTTTYTVLARGGQYIINGAGFTGATAVTIGSNVLTSSEFTVNNNNQILITELPDSVTTGTGRNLTVTTPAGTSAAHVVTVISLVINELDADTSGGTPNRQFIEIKTGVSSAVNLTGYALILYNSAGEAYNPVTDSIGGCSGVAFDGLLGTTDASGRYTVGGKNGALSSNECINDGQLALAGAATIIQRTTRTPTTTTVNNTAGRFIDAIRYHNNADSSNSNGSSTNSCTNPNSNLNSLSAGNVQCEHQDNDSLSRCSTSNFSRRDNNVFIRRPYTRGNLTNNCP